MDLPTGWDVPPQHDCPHHTAGRKLVAIVDPVTMDVRWYCRGCRTFISHGGDHRPSPIQRPRRPLPVRKRTWEW